MKSKAKAWFSGLSMAGKIVTIAVSGVLLMAGLGALAGPCETTYKTVSSSQDIPYEASDTKDPTMKLGEVKVTKPGANGSKQFTHKVGTNCRKQIVSKDLLKTVVKLKPVTEERLVGSKEITLESEDVTIPFDSQTVYDSSMNKGTSKVTQKGVNGSKKVTYEVVKIDGKEQSRTQKSEEITKQLVTQITHIGTKQTYSGGGGSNCDSNYSGACVPIASDVDCAGGSGNGPAYVAGPVYVTGSDIYGLDRDGDGVGCE